MNIDILSEQELVAIGGKIGSALVGGEVIELVGDVGAGKTTLTKAIAGGMGITDTISSPSYTLSQVYEAPSGTHLRHYDFYRLEDPGILAAELEEVLQDNRTIVVIEWGGIVAGILPSDHLQIKMIPTGETTRQLSFQSGGEKSRRLMERLK